MVALAAMTLLASHEPARADDGGWLSFLPTLPSLIPDMPSFMPPVRYEGEFLTTARVSMPEEGRQTFQIGGISRISASTHIWEPWFATTTGSLTLTQLNTFGASTVSTVIAGGELRLSMFPRSRFPFEGFFRYSDSTTELESTFIEEREEVSTRFGFIQRYRPMSGESDYSLRYERSTDDSITDALQTVSDFIELQGTYRLSDQSVSASLSMQHIGRDNPQASFLDVIANARHSYRPLDTLSVETFASLSSTRSEADTTEFSTANAQISSFASWRPRDVPLTVSASARTNTSTTEASGVSTSNHSASVNLSGSYAYSAAVRLGASLSGSVSKGGGASSGQSVTASYSPASLDLLGMTYAWYASSSASNQLGAGGDARSVSASVGHTLSHVLPLNDDGTLNVSMSAGQVGGGTLLASTGISSTVSHNLSLGLAHRASFGTSRARVDVQDSRQFGTDSESTATQSASLQLVHDSVIGRYVTLGGTASLSYTRQESDTAGPDEFPSSSLSLRVNHGRVFGVRRLRFNSQLRASADSLTFIGAGDQGVRDISWDNRLEYAIGRMDLRLTGAVTETSGRINSVVFLSIARRIGGVL